MCGDGGSKKTSDAPSKEDSLAPSQEFLEAQKGLMNGTYTAEPGQGVNGTLAGAGIEQRSDGDTGVGGVAPAA